MDHRAADRGYEAIILDVAGGIATITLNRPEHRNAWNGTMDADLSRALGWCDGTDEV